MTIEEMRHIDALKTYKELEEAKAEIERLRKANLQLREGAEEQKQRIKRLEEAFTELEQCNLTDENCANMDVATRRIRNFARRAKEAKP